MILNITLSKAEIETLIEIQVAQKYKGNFKIHWEYNDNRKIIGVTVVEGLSEETIDDYWRDH